MECKLQPLPLFLALISLQLSLTVPYSRGFVKVNFFEDHPTLLREPRQTFLQAKIIEEKPKEVPESLSGLGSEEKVTDYSGSFSSSSEEEDVRVVNSQPLSTTLKSVMLQTSSLGLGTQHDGLGLVFKEPHKGIKQLRQSDKGHNWYVYNNKPGHTKEYPSEEGVSSEEGTGNSNGNKYGNNGTNGGTQNPGGNSGGTGNVGESFSEEKDGNRPGRNTGITSNGILYKVQRARPRDIVDPDGYNYFQFKPSSKLGWLWLSNRIITHTHRIDLGDDRDRDLDEYDVANNYDWEFRRYDRACLYEEGKKKKGEAVIPIIPEELKRTVDIQNEQLARRFLDWQFVKKESFEEIALKGEGENHPLYLTYKFLYLTMQLFRDKICRNASSYADSSAASAPPGVKVQVTGNPDHKLLPKSFVEEMFRLFLALRDITLPKNVPDYATKSDEQEIYKDVLEKCKAEEQSIHWFSHSCGDQVLSVDQPNNFACTPLEIYDFNHKLYDPVLDSMWHMFNAVHAYCFNYFRVNPRLWHRYSLIIANSFTVSMRQRWKASTAFPKFYRRLLGPDHEVHLETINRCMFATVLRSNVPALLPRFDSLSPITFGKERLVNKDSRSGNDVNELSD